MCQVLEGKTAPVYCRPVDVSEGADRALEREANVFSAELLMPEPLVRGEFAADPTLEPIAARCAVSVEAMAWRLYNLGLAEVRPVQH